MCVLETAHNAADIVQSPLFYQCTTLRYHSTSFTEGTIKPDPEKHKDSTSSKNHSINNRWTNITEINIHGGYVVQCYRTLIFTCNMNEVEKVFARAPSQNTDA